MESAGLVRTQRILFRTSTPVCRHVLPTRVSWLPGIGVSRYGGHPSTSRRSLSSADEDTSTAQKSVEAGVRQLDPDHSEPPVETTAQHTSAGAEVSAVEQPQPQPLQGVERDWLQPPPEDWGGVADPHAIKEPDSSGVWFFFILIAGLSIGVQQLLRLAGARGSEEPVVRPLPSAAVVVASQAPRALSRPSVTPSKPEASAEASPSPAAGLGCAGASSGETAPPSTPERPSAAGVTPAVESKGEQAGPVQGRTATAGRAGEARTGREAHEGQSVSEVGTEEATEWEAGTEEPQPTGRPGVSIEVQQQGRGTPGAASQPVAGAGGAGALEAGRVTTSGADAVPAVKGSAAGVGPTDESRLVADLQQQRRLQEQRQQQEQGSRDAVSGEANQSRMWLVGAGSATRGEAAPPSSWAGRQGVDGAGPAGQAEEPPSRVGAPSTSTASSAAATDGASVGGPTRPSLGTPGQAGPGPGSAAAAAPAKSPEPVSAFGPIGFRGNGDGSTTAQPEVPAWAVAPARLSLPAVLPEPLSRAPDSSALAHLPNDDSLGSLRERAQLALRAAASASEASQRAAAYAAAASSAASRAAEAAERAAAAATSAQAGLESAAESAIAAAEARVALAAEAAKEAEGRAASAAAHATAYQDMSQSQADIAERASNTSKPAPQGPFSQLHQFWRSAFTHSSPSNQAQQQQLPQSRGKHSGVNTPWTERGADSSNLRSSADAVGPDTQGAPSGGAAETISTTVKGFLSWLGQGDGATR